MRIISWSREWFLTGGCWDYRRGVSYHMKYFSMVYDFGEYRVCSSHLVGGCILGVHLMKEGVAPKQMPFFVGSNENIFFKTQGSRLRVIDSPNKVLVKSQVYKILNS